MYDFLKSKARHIDELLYLSGLSISDLALILLNLELEGLILSMPGKFYQLP